MITCGVTISSGNSKIGKIPNVSLTPGKGCTKGIKCTKKCYAQKAFRQYSNVRQAWNDNLAIAKGAPYIFFGALRTYMRRQAPLYFRWHVAGDILDQEYFRCMCQVARANPRVRHLVYTKNYNIKFSRKPKNLTVLLSAWPGVGHRKIRTWGGMPVAWMKDKDHRETRIPSKARKCPGKCTTCKLCWNLKPGQHVYFEEH